MGAFGREPTSEAEAWLTLFQQGDFTLHSGERSGFKIECDALMFDYAWLARLVSEAVQIQRSLRRSDVAV